MIQNNHLTFTIKIICQQRFTLLHPLCNYAEKVQQRWFKRVFPIYVSKKGILKEHLIFGASTVQKMVSERAKTEGGYGDTCNDWIVSYSYCYWSWSYSYSLIISLFNNSFTQKGKRICFLEKKISDDRRRRNSFVKKKNKYELRRQPHVWFLCCFNGCY